MNGQPLRFYDPFGLFGMDDVWGGVYWATGGWSPSQELVDFSAGFGDAVLFDVPNWVRDQFGINGSVNKCSGAYGAGGTVGGMMPGLVAAGGRVGYIAEIVRAGKKAKGLAATEANARGVVTARNMLKDKYRGPLWPRYWKDWHKPSYEKLRETKTDRQILDRAGNPNWGFSIGIIGAGSGSAAVAAAADRGCGCE